MLAKTKFTLLGLVILLGLLPALFSVPVTLAADDKWQATYYDGPNFTGTAVQRQESSIDHDWGVNQPRPEISRDEFSVRWTRTVNLPAGKYRFVATMDDGMRVWVDDALIIDSWEEKPKRTLTAERTLTAGDHRFVVEYFDNFFEASARFGWQLATSGPTQIRNWKGEYFDNRSLSGVPVQVRDDNNISFNWGTGRPTDLVPADNFSVRWTRTLNLAAGRYRFTTNTDDGVRLWVNDALVIDKWRDQTPTSYSADVDVPSGTAKVKMEYYDAGSGAVANLSWSPLTPTTINNWRGEYFNNINLSGSPVAVRDDGNVNFNWGDGSPVNGVVNRDNFSVRWTRSVPFSAARYRFTTNSDDGVRLWVNNQLIIDQWRDQAATGYSAEIDLPAGTVPIKMEYYDRAGGALASLSWTAVGSVVTPPPATGTGGMGTATVATTRLNLRSGPGVANGIVTVLNRGTMINLLGYRNADATWVAVGLSSGTTGWVYAPYITPSVPVSSLPVWNGSGGQPQPQPANANATVATAHLNARSGPGISFTILSVLDRGDRLTLTHRNSAGNWVKGILANGTTAWVHAGYIQTTVSVNSLPIANN